MKKENYVSILFILIANLSLAQDKGYVAVSIEPGIPMEDFVSKNASNIAAGFANAGGIFDVSFHHKLVKYFGISALFRGHANTTDAQAIENALARELNNITWIVESNPWSMGGILIGRTASIPIGIKDKVSFESLAIFGFLNVTSSKKNITERTNSQSEWEQQHSKMPTEISYFLGLGSEFKFKIAKRL